MCGGGMGGVLQSPIQSSKAFCALVILYKNQTEHVATQAKHAIGPPSEQATQQSTHGIN
jgi:hypothetical protein